MTKIIHVSTLKPRYRNTTAQVIEAAERLWLKDVDPKIRRMAVKLFEGAKIDSRYSVVPVDVAFGDYSFEERNDMYIEAMIDMGSKVLTKALEESGTRPDEIDCLVTTSCTGFMIPSVDAYLVNMLGMRNDVIRLPVTEMGCAGGTSGLIYADQYLKANPDKKVAMLNLETPSLTFQKKDFSMENLVSTAIFADGASCVLLGGNNATEGPQILDSAMYHFPDATHLMGYRLQNSGLKIVLDKDVPDSINAHFPKILHPFLERNNLALKKLSIICSTRAEKIITAAEDYLGRYGKDVSVSKQVLVDHGNMSSATVIHILERFMSKGMKKNDKAFMLAFGPGFMAQTLLLEWK